MAGPATPNEMTLQPLSSRAALPLGGVAIPNYDRGDRFAEARNDMANRVATDTDAPSDGW